MNSGGDRPTREPTRSEISAGGVVIREGDAGPEVILASRRTQTGDVAWGLPKGRVDPGEDLETTALREVLEETGLVGEIREDLGTLSYFYRWDGVRISKVVHFYLMRFVGGDVSEHDEEMEEVRWVPLADAPTLASYPSERDLLVRAAERW
ncbi:MAG: NUDIX hydrolase [Actinomycetota bacterium]